MVSFCGDLFIHIMGKKVSHTPSSPHPPPISLWSSIGVIPKSELGQGKKSKNIAQTRSLFCPPALFALWTRQDFCPTLVLRACLVPWACKSQINAVQVKGLWMKEKSCCKSMLKVDIFKWIMCPKRENSVHDQEKCHLHMALTIIVFTRHILVFSLVTCLCMQSSLSTVPVPVASTPTLPVAACIRG